MLREAFSLSDDVIDPTTNHLGSPAVEVRGLRKRYPGGVEAVRGVDFEVAGGEVFGLLGPNGAGKSTIVGMLTTTIAPTGGKAVVGGHDVGLEPLAARAVSSVVFQDAVVDAGLSGRANLELHRRLWGIPSREAEPRISELTAALGLEAFLDRSVATYSGGQRRRLEIARALCSSPRILFLDEPTVGLDPRIRHELLDVIADLRDRAELTVVLTTHYLDEASRLCDRVAIIHRGSLVALDSPAALLAGMGREILELRVEGDGSAALGRLRERGIGGSDSYVLGARVTVPLHEHGAGDVFAALDSAGITAVEISTRAPTLDDVYLRLTGEAIETAP